MKSVIKSSIFTIAVAALALIVFPAAAQIGPIDADECARLGIGNCGSTTNDLKTVIVFIVNSFLSLVGVIAVGFVVWGGVQIIGSAGDEQRAASGKKAVTYAVVGLIIVGLAAIIVNFTLGAAGSEQLGVGGTSDLRQFLINVINVFLSLVGVIATGFIIWGGVQLIGSTGDEQKASAGKKAITYAVIGLVVVGLAAILVNFVLAAAGSNVIGFDGTRDLPSAILFVINAFLSLVAVVALVFLVVAGIRLISSSGDEQVASEAKKAIIYAVLGLVVIGLAAAIVNFVIVTVVR